MKHTITEAKERVGRQKGWRVPALALLTALPLAGCNNLLDVENPNQLVQEDLEKPIAAGAIVNGALSTVARGHAHMLLTHATISDELKWVGSRDGWKEYASGNVSNPANEFADLIWPFINEGRWTADEAIRLLSGFDSNGQLTNRNLLAQAYLYSAISYTSIPSMYEDFVISNRRDASPPIGKTNMVKMFDQAIGNLDKALGIAQATKNTDLQRTILAQRAQTKYSKALWGKLNPGVNRSNPLVNDPGAVADAEAFLATNPPTDWRFRFTYSATTVPNEFGAWVNERLEMRLGDPYVVPTANDKQMARVRLLDPIDRVPDPALSRSATEATSTRQFGPITVLSWREMQLILAEAALAAGNTAKFTTHVNAVRAVDNLTQFSNQIPNLEMLQHMRMSNLFLQNRRLADMYRFGITSPEWHANSDVAKKPGSLLPIANIERISNCHIVGGC